MDAKLTLKLDKDVIARAKEYAAEKQMSLSRIIEQYLKVITSSKQPVDEIELTPFVKSFMDSEVQLPHDLDIKKEVVDYLEKKHK